MDTSFKQAFPWLTAPEDRNGPATGSFGNTVCLWVLLAIAYVASGRLIFALTGNNETIGGFAFFPAGIALFFTIAFGIRVWPGVFLGQLLLALWGGLPAAAAGALASIASLESILGSLLFWQYGLSRSLSGFRSVSLLFGLITLILQPLSATVGIFSLYEWGGLTSESAPKAWLYWWAGHAVGEFLVVPLLLSWTRPVVQPYRGEIAKVVLLVGVYLLPLIYFAYVPSGKNEPLLRLIFFTGFYLISILLAVQTSLRTLTLANLIMSTFFLWMIANGTTFLILVSVTDRLAGTSIFIMAGTITSLLLSAIWGELMERKEQLRESNTAKERLFSVIGHDLNAPVANLKSSLELLIEGRFSPEEFREFQEELLKGVNHVHQTLRNLMEWGGFQMRSHQPRFGEISLSASVTESIQLLERIAQEKKISLENGIPPEAVVRADPNQIQSVIRNLLSNALKFTLPGGSIVLSARLENDFWRTSVRDSGIGMAPERVARLFSSQSEYVSTPGTADEQGLGLGLQICANFIQANHGRISVESELGRGTTFHFTLPKSTGSITTA